MYNNRSKLAVKRSVLAKLKADKEKLKDTVIESERVETHLSTVTGTISSFLLNGVLQGTSQAERIGREISMNSLEVRLAMRTHFTWTTDNVINIPRPQAFRIAVVYDRTPSGSVPSWVTVFTANEGGNTEASSLNAPARADHLERFDILHEEIFTVPYPTFPYVGGYTYTDLPQYTDTFTTFRIPLRGRVATYSGAGAAPADVRTGGLYLMAVAYYNTEAPSNVITFTQFTYTYARLAYQDE